ncbi:MAG: protease HtpX [Gammaproteobacteria bacterium]
MKRILLFVATNVAVLAVITIVFRVLGLENIISETGGLNLTSLLVFSAVIGFGGSLISLAISKKVAIMTTGAKVIGQPASAVESWLVNTVQAQATRAGIGMPDVAVYDAPEVNAFATGMSRNKALVAVSSGLLSKMDRTEAEAVLAHEVSHIANGDMVTMTLLQGVLNTFVIFLSRVVGFFVDRVVFRNEHGAGIGFFLTSLVAQILFGILATIIVHWFSRRREFRADAGGADLAGRAKMIAALEKLRATYEPSELPRQLSAFGISGLGAEGLRKLFMTHPPLQDRIAALKEARV